MTTDLNNSILKHSLGSFSRDRQLAFMLLLCERMMPALNRFAVETNYDISLYRRCLDDAWSCLAGIGNLSNYGELAEECLDSAPDTEEFNHPLISAALNAALSVAGMMSFLADDNVDHVVEAAGLASDTVALYAQDVAATPPRSLGFQEIMGHPLMKQELQQQLDDLKFLEALPMDISQEMIPLIKKHAEDTSLLIFSGNYRNKIR